MLSFISKIENFDYYKLFQNIKTYYLFFYFVLSPLFWPSSIFIWIMRYFFVENNRPPLRYLWKPELTPKPHIVARYILDYLYNEVVGMRLINFIFFLMLISCFIISWFLFFSVIPTIYTIYYIVNKCVCWLTQIIFLLGYFIIRYFFKTIKDNETYIIEYTVTLKNFMIFVVKPAVKSSAWLFVSVKFVSLFLIILKFNLGRVCADSICDLCLSTTTFLVNTTWLKLKWLAQYHCGWILFIVVFISFYCFNLLNLKGLKFLSITFIIMWSYILFDLYYTKYAVCFAYSLFVTHPQVELVCNNNLATFDIDIDKDLIELYSKNAICKAISNTIEFWITSFYSLLLIFILIKNIIKLLFFNKIMLNIYGRLLKILYYVYLKYLVIKWYKNKFNL